jgi:hypothetical protein
VDFCGMKSFSGGWGINSKSWALRAIYYVHKMSDRILDEASAAACNEYMMLRKLGVLIHRYIQYCLTVDSTVDKCSFPTELRFISLTTKVPVRQSSIDDTKLWIRVLGFFL